VLKDLDKREPDSAEFIRPQERYADIVIKFIESEGGDPDKLDAQIILRETLPHPDLSPFLSDPKSGIELIEEGNDECVRIPGDIKHDDAEAIENSIWERLHFASHLRTERLGQFTAGKEEKRSDSLALVQLLVLYHMVTAKAAVSLGSEGARTDDDGENGNGEQQSDDGDKES
jgi:phosphoribulokinase